jgi:hypothetical protein
VEYLLPVEAFLKPRRIRTFAAEKNIAEITRNQKREKFGGTRKRDRKIPSSIAISSRQILSVLIAMPSLAIVRLRDRI